MGYAELIETFYQAFARRDAAAMVACYAPNVVFQDPAFGRLQGARAGAMWTMLCGQAKDLVVKHRDVRIDGERGTAHWDADYLFSKTGRQVHNSIDASFRFADGKIVEHTDVFSMWKWSRQALGPAGWLLGWTPIVSRGVQKQANAGLDAFMAKAGTA